MNGDLSRTTYFTLLQGFLETVGSSITAEDCNKRSGVVEMATQTLVLRLIPHGLTENLTEPDAIIVEVDLMLLDLNKREMNHDRFLILHQLNAASRFTTGIMAFITEAGMLSVSKIIPIAGLDEKSFPPLVAEILHAAEALYEGWNHLADLAQDNDMSGKKISFPTIEINQKA